SGPAQSGVARSDGPSAQPPAGMETLILPVTGDQQPVGVALKTDVVRLEPWTYHSPRDSPKEVALGSSQPGLGRHTTQRSINPGVVCSGRVIAVARLAREVSEGGPAPPPPAPQQKAGHFVSLPPPAPIGPGHQGGAGQKAIDSARLVEPVHSRQHHAKRRFTS